MSESVSVEVYNAAPAMEAEGERRIWIQDPDAFRYWPFAKWANVDVEGSPKLTRLFAGLTLQTNSLVEDIDSLVLPAPRYHPTLITRKYITPSELTDVRSGVDDWLRAWHEESSFSDAGSTLVELPAQRSPTLNPFKISGSDAWFPSGAYTKFRQPHPSPFNELYPFPASATRVSKRSQAFQPSIERYQMQEVAYKQKLEDLNRAGVDESHPIAFKITQYLSRTLSKQGKDRQAEGLLRKLLLIEAGTDKARHRDMLSVEIDLIDNLSHQGRAFEARELHELVETEIERSFTPHDHLFRKSMKSMTKILRDTGQEKELEAKSRQLTQVNLVYLGPKNHGT